MFEKQKSGRPRRHDKRLKNLGNCLVCGWGLDTLRMYCDERCRKRAQRLRARGL